MEITPTHPTPCPSPSPISNQALVDLLLVKDDDRNTEWENLFFKELSMGSLDLISSDPQTGPDGWPYLLAKVERESSESFQKVLQWIHDKGIGLVINPQKEYPDFVFTYGMLWYFKETGLFFGKPQPVKEGVFEIQVKDIKIAGNPSEQYWPPYARKIVREFLIQQGVLQPRVLVLSCDGVNFELAFSKESLGHPDPTEHQGILEALAWFMPPHYQLSMVSEKELPWPFIPL